MGVIRYTDGTQETVAVKKLKNMARNTPETHDLQRERDIMKVIYITAALPYVLFIYIYMYFALILFIIVCVNRA